MASGNHDRLASVLDISSEKELSYLCDLSQVQDSFRMRAERRSLLFSQYLIDEKAELKTDRLAPLLKALETEGPALYAFGPHDVILLQHQIKIIKRLIEDPNFYKTIKKFQKPLCHRGAEDLIREAFSLSSANPITEMEIRRAVLSACLTLLRQNVGSCFATAPAILIHEEQTDQFLADLLELLATGKLKRTFAGVEHSVPLSPSSGMGDLKKNVEEAIIHSPGLKMAFQAAGFPMNENSLNPYLKRGITIEELIQDILLSHFQLKRKDIEDIAARMRGPFADFDRGSKKRELIDAYTQKEKEVKAAFKAFADHPLLKAWEFTIASFSEIKMIFSNWNLYASLGFNPDEQGGIGEILYNYINRKLLESNEKMDEVHKQYEIAFDQLRATEVLLRNVSSESEARRLRAEYQSRYAHMQACLDLRNQIHNRAVHYPNFFNFLIKQYEEKFPEYFQEIYDAEMQGFKSESYDDSPAGFRLVYKHGRSDASVWTLIRTPQQWLEALSSFFVSVENAISANCDSDEAKQDVLLLTTEIVSYLRTEEFLESAILRMGKAHRVVNIQSPLKKLDQIEKKPWAYTSGGSMEILIKTYFRRENEITMESRKVESPLDLGIFILDTLKSLPPRITDPYLKDANKGMLMHSPTHAFILHPGLELIKEGWQDNGFTYTWVRDVLLKPREDFFAKMLLSPDEQQFLIDRFSQNVSPMVAHQLQKIRTPIHLNLSDFRESLAEMVDNTSLLDGFLYQSVPLTPAREVLEVLKELINKEITDFEPISVPYLTRNEMEHIARQILISSPNPPSDIHGFVAKRASNIELAPPEPFIFADTNWATFYFSLLVNPGTGKFELWRTDRTGSTGFPMNNWTEWLNGTTHIPWVIYTHPYEYFR